MAYKNYKVTFNMDGRGVIFNPAEPIHLDSLLTFCRLYKSENFKDDLGRDDPIEDIPLNLNKEIINGVEVWKASAILPDGDIFYGRRFFKKSFPNERADGLTSGKYDFTKGTYRSYKNDLTPILCKTMIAYFNGDEKVKDALKDINQIGHKRAQGFGNIISIDIDEVDYDFSIIKDGLANRFYPHPDGICQIRAKPPYWSNYQKISCFPVGWAL